MAKRRRDQGLGSVIRHKGCKRWVIQYYVDGKPVREATGLTDRVEAQKVLTARLNAVAKGEPVTVRPVRCSELYDHLVKHNQLNGKNTDTARWLLHLQPVFQHTLATRLSSTMVLEYRAQRQQAGAAVATVNRELALLRHMLRRAHRDGLIAAAPHIELAKEDNVREGFVADAQLDAMRQAAKPLWLRALVELAAMYGWRRGELVGLTVGQVDWDARVIRLGVGTTKNEEGREVPITPSVLPVLQAACDGKKANQHVLTHPDGSPVIDPRCAWRNLCCAVGVGAWHCTTKGCGTVQAKQGRCPKCKARSWQYVGLLVHDMRRTAARNLRRAGVDEVVAMTITGHKTASQYRRYNIVNNADKVAAMQRVERMQAKQQRARAARSVSGKVVGKPQIAGVQNSGSVQ